MAPSPRRARPAAAASARLVYRGRAVAQLGRPALRRAVRPAHEPDGRQLRAVSDCGYGFTATLSYDADGRLQGLERAAPLRSDRHRTGEPLRVSERDAESLVVHGDRLEVGFEGKARIFGLRARSAVRRPRRVARRRPRACGTAAPTPARDDDDARRRAPAAGLRGAAHGLGRRAGVDRHRPDPGSSGSYPLLFEGGWAGEPFRPTAAALLPDGDVLVLERRFPPIASRVVRLTPAELDGRRPAAPAEVAARSSRRSRSTTSRASTRAATRPGARSSTCSRTTTTARSARAARAAPGCSGRCC